MFKQEIEEKPLVETEAITEEEYLVENNFIIDSESIVDIKPSDKESIKIHFCLGKIFQLLYYFSWLSMDRQIDNCNNLNLIVNTFRASS